MWVREIDHRMLSDESMDFYIGFALAVGLALTVVLPVGAIALIIVTAI